MLVAAVAYMIAICIGVMIVWGWVALVSEAIARRTGASPRVPYPGDALWARCGGTLLSLGLFGGAPTLKRHLQQGLHQRALKRHRVPSGDTDPRFQAASR